MRHLISTLILTVCCIFCTQFVFCDTIPTKGEWGPEDVRSVAPVPPTASIDGKILTIQFTTPLSDLTVTVTDNETGVVVYEDCISSTGLEILPVSLDAENGNYTLTMTHKLGYLIGTFVIK